MMRLVDQFISYLQYEQNRSQHTVLAYKEDIDQFLHFVSEQRDNCELEDIDADIIRDWVMSLMSEGYSSTSVNRKLSTLRSLYRYLMRKKLVKADPLRKVVGPKNKKPLPAFVKEKDMNELLDDTPFDDNFEGVRDHLILEMFYETGMRRAELLGLRDEDVDFSAHLIKVTGKRNKQRLIPFGDKLKDAIIDYLARRKEIKKEDSTLFINVKGKALSEGKVYEIVKTNLSKVVTLKKRSPHVLRHSFATAMLNHDAKLSAVKELLGHNSLATTQIYTHTTFEELKEAYKHAHPRA
jgi:integrase/recombinase XerC